MNFLSCLTSGLFYVLFGPFLVVSSETQKVSLSSSDLMAVFAVIRHGDRAPTDFYPNDPFKNASFWEPNGIGEMNPLGIERMGASGHLYRDRYKPFLDRTNGWPTYVRSSTRNRTIQSARYFLETFLNDPSKNISEMITLDQRMLTTSYPCNRSNAAWLSWFSSPEVTGYMASKKGDIEHLQGLTGDDYFSAKPFTLRNLEFLATTTSIERDEYGLPVPEWIKNRTNIELMDDFKKHAYLFDWRPPVVQKYRVGVLLGDIRDNIQSLISPKSSKNQSQTFFLYSTHDVNQVLLLQSLGLYEQIGNWPTTYSSAIVFEVYSQPNTNPDYLIRTLYREVNKTSASYWSNTFNLVDQPLNITECENQVLASFEKETLEHLCPFEEFKKLIADKVPLNYEEECSRSSAQSVKSFGVVLFFITSLLIVLFF